MVDKLEKIAQSVVQTFLKKFHQKTNVKNLALIDPSGNIMLSISDFTPEQNKILNFFANMKVFDSEFEKNEISKNIKQIILDFSDNNVILSVLESKNYILTISDKNLKLGLVLNELKTLITSIDEFFYDKNVLDKYHLANLDENIKKLEKYLEIMQPPKFKDIAKLIEYIS